MKVHPKFVCISLDLKQLDGVTFTATKLVDVACRNNIHFTQRSFLKNPFFYLILVSSADLFQVTQKENPHKLRETITTAEYYTRMIF